MSLLNCHASYLVSWVNEDPVVIATDLMNKTQRVRFDTLVGTGLSGALVVPNVARVLDKHWLIVRKSSDSHSTFREAEGVLGKRWLFVDDLISSGHTYRRVKHSVGELATKWCHRCSHAGVYLYTEHRFQKA